MDIGEVLTTQQLQLNVKILMHELEVTTQILNLHLSELQDIKEFCAPNALFTKELNMKVFLDSNVKNALTLSSIF